MTYETDRSAQRLRRRDSGGRQRQWREDLRWRWPRIQGRPLRRLRLRRLHHRIDRIRQPMLDDLCQT